MTAEGGRAPMRRRDFVGKRAHGRSGYRGEGVARKVQWRQYAMNVFWVLLIVLSCLILLSSPCSCRGALFRLCCSCCPCYYISSLVLEAEGPCHPPLPQYLVLFSALSKSPCIGGEWVGLMSQPGGGPRLLDSSLGCSLPRRTSHPLTWLHRCSASAVLRCHQFVPLPATQRHR